VSLRENPCCLLETDSLYIYIFFVRTSAEELVKTLNEKKLAAGILLDTHDPQVMGGSGKAFDWSVASHVQSQCPMILAGGLNPENIAR